MAQLEDRFVFDARGLALRDALLPVLSAPLALQYSDLSMHGHAIALVHVHRRLIGDPLVCFCVCVQSVSDRRYRLGLALGLSGVFMWAFYKLGDPFPIVKAHHGTVYPLFGVCTC